MMCQGEFSNFLTRVKMEKPYGYSKNGGKLTRRGIRRSALERRKGNYKLEIFEIGLS